MQNKGPKDQIESILFSFWTSFSPPFLLDKKHLKERDCSHPDKAINISWAFSGVALFVLAEVIWFCWGYFSLRGFGFG